MITEQEQALHRHLAHHINVSVLTESDFNAGWMAAMRSGGVQALVDTCKEWKRFFQTLVENSDPKDSLVIARQRFHGERIDMTTNALVMFRNASKKIKIAVDLLDISKSRPIADSRVDYLIQHPDYLNEPITVTTPFVGDSYVVVNGGHRVAAFRKLGRVEIEAYEV